MSDFTTISCFSSFLRSSCFSFPSFRSCFLSAFSPLTLLSSSRRPVDDALSADYNNETNAMSGNAHLIARIIRIIPLPPLPPPSHHESTILKFYYIHRLNLLNFQNLMYIHSNTSIAPSQDENANIPVRCRYTPYLSNTL